MSFTCRMLNSVECITSMHSKEQRLAILIKCLPGARHCLTLTGY